MTQDSTKLYDSKQRVGVREEWIRLPRDDATWTLKDAPSIAPDILAFLPSFSRILDSTAPPLTDRDKEHGAALRACSVTGVVLSAAVTMA